MTFFTETFATGDTIDADSRAAREGDPSDLTRLFAMMSASITYGKLTRSHPMRISASGQHPRCRAVCLGSRGSPRLKSAIASPPTQNDKLDAYHDIHHRMAQWQAHPS